MDLKEEILKISEGNQLETEIAVCCLENLHHILVEQPQFNPIHIQSMNQNINMLGPPIPYNPYPSQAFSSNTLTNEQYNPTPFFNSQFSTDRTPQNQSISFHFK